MTNDSIPARKSWPDYRAVWRWHFYASLFCIPFVIVLATSGAIYLFKPQIEAWNDRAYDHLEVRGPSGQRRRADSAALAAVPGAGSAPTNCPLAADCRRAGHRAANGGADAGLCSSGHARGAGV